MIEKKVLFSVDVFDDGDFTVKDPETQKPLERISDEEMFERLIKLPIVPEGSFTSSAVTYFKQNSGTIIILGRKYKIP